MNRGFLLDTNIPSEQIQPEPNPMRRTWTSAQIEESLFLSAITIGELQKGMILLPPGKRRARLEYWFENDLIPRFRYRTLSVTPAIARIWGWLTAQRHLAGRSLSAADGLIAATALEHDLALVTRNGKDFVDLGLTLINPSEL